MPRPFTLFVGSGISLPAPSSLPLFTHLRDAARQGLDPLLRTRFDYVGSEPLFHALNEARVDMKMLLAKVFSSANPQPNAVHLVLASLLLRNPVTTIWTTNYDNLIEDAARLIERDRAKRQEAFRRLRKPHGTFLGASPGKWIDGERMLFSAQHVLAEWKPREASRLAEDMRDADVLLVGYSGQDVNAYEPLRVALSQAKSVTWLVLLDSVGKSVEQQSVLFRFPDLSEDDVVAVSNPAAEFVDRFESKAHIDLLTYLPTRYLTAPVDSNPADVSTLTQAVAQHGTQAMLAAQLGERDVAKDLLSDAISLGRRALMPRVKSLRHAPPLQHTRAKVRAMFGRVPEWLPSSDAAKSRFIADRSFDSPQEALALISRIDTWLKSTNTPAYHSRLLLEQSMMLRYVGRYRTALAKAQLALNLARERSSPLPTEAARAEFELIESRRTLGDFPQVFNLLRLRLHTLGMSHWGAWLDYARACVHLQFRELSQAEEMLRKAHTFFFSVNPLRPQTAFNPSDGQYYVRLTWCALRRVQGDFDSAQKELNLHDHEASARHSQRFQWIRSFQQGEIFRGQKAWADARAQYMRACSGIEIGDPLAKLGMAFCDWAEGSDPTTNLLESIDRFYAAECWFGLGWCAQLGNSLQNFDSPKLHSSGVSKAAGHLFAKGLSLDPSAQVAWI